MFALVTQADGTSRGQPWVTFAIAIGLVVGFFSLQPGVSAQREAAVELQLDEAVAYFSTHPYLELEASLLERVGGEAGIEELEAAYYAERSGRGLSVIPSSIKRRTQRKLDGMIEAALAQRAQLPPWRLGVIDSSSPAANLFLHAIVHATVPALLVTLFFFLCLGAAIEGGWGSLAFAGFCALAVPLSGVAYAQLHGGLGLPWHGAGGLVAVLLGAYFVRSIRWPARLMAGIPMPGWLLLAAWIPAEYLVVRGLDPRDLSSGPTAAHGAAFGLGLVVALVVYQLGLEGKLRAKDEKNAELLSNPILDKALAAHETGRTTEAYEMLKPEVTANPKHRDLVIGFWTLARACGAEAEAAPFMLGLIRQELQRGKRTEAMEHWLEVADAAPHVQAEPALLVRLGEALLDEGQPNDALLTFARALDDPGRVTAPLAMRVVRITRDLDPAITGRAAALALQDDQLEPEERARLEALTETLEPSAVRPSVSEKVEEDHASLESNGAAVTAAAPSASGDLGLDPLALSTDSLAAETASDAPAAEDMEKWNDPGVVSDLSAELEDDGEAFDESGLEAAGYDAQDYGAVNLADVDADVAATAEEADPDGTAPMLEGVQDPDAAGRTTAVDLDGEAAPAEEPDLDVAVAERELKLLAGIPVRLDSEGIKVEIESRGKTKIPLERVEALAVAAVSGLGERPVLLIDLVLNWMALSDEPLKVVRLRSDRFDPGSLMPNAGSSMDAIKAMLELILEASGATPLPNVEAATGASFATFESLDAYHSEVLMVRGVAS